MGSWFVPNANYTLGCIGIKTYLVDGISMTFNSSNFIDLTVLPTQPPLVTITYVWHPLCTPHGLQMCSSRHVHAIIDGHTCDHIAGMNRVYRPIYSVQNTSLMCSCSSCNPNDKITYTWKATQKMTGTTATLNVKLSSSQFAGGKSGARRARS
jgi:hypothetical protein